MELLGNELRATTGWTQVLESVKCYSAVPASLCASVSSRQGQVDGQDWWEEEGGEWEGLGEAASFLILYPSSLSTESSAVLLSKTKT